MDNNGSDKEQIMYIHHGRDPGGAPTSLFNLINSNHIESNHNIVVACMHRQMLDYFGNCTKALVVNFPKSGLISGRIFIGMTPITIKNIRFFLKELITFPLSLYRAYVALNIFNAKIVHLNSSILWIVGIAVKLSGKKLVWHIREATSENKYNLFKKIYVKFILKISDEIICIGQQEYKNFSGNCNDNVHLIYNSLDRKWDEVSSDEDARACWNVCDHSFVYLSLGGGSFRKGAYQLIEALKYLKDNFHCAIIGDFPDTDNEILSKFDTFLLKFENFLFEKNISSLFSWKYNKRLKKSVSEIDSHRLFLIGHLEDVRVSLNSADVLVFAGTTPHSGRPIYEAWALKKPVVVFDSEVMRLDIEHMVDGIIVEKHCAKELAKALVTLQSNPELCIQLGENGYQKMKSRYDQELNSFKICQLYKGLLSENFV